MCKVILHCHHKCSKIAYGCITITVRVQARQLLQFPSACCVEHQFVMCMFCHTATVEIQTCLYLCSIELISCLLPCAWRAQMRLVQGCFLSNAKHLAYEAQHLLSCVTDVLIVGYMVEKPSTVDKAIAYVWDIPDTVIGPADKQSLTAALAEKTDAVTRRYFSAPNPELWVGTLRELLKPTGTFSHTIWLWLQLQMVGLLLVSMPTPNGHCSSLSLCRLPFSI